MALLGQKRYLLIYRLFSSTGNKFRNVTSFRNLNDNRIIHSLSKIIFCQRSSEPAGMNSNNRITFWIKIPGTIKYMNGNRILFYLQLPVLEGFTNNKVKESAQYWRAFE